MFDYVCLLGKKRLDNEIEEEGHKHTHTQKENDQQRIMNTPSMTQSHIRLEQCFECYK